jgi:uncharacterized protein YehS (DUF1456 family)
MTNNDVLRTLRYALELDPNTLLALFAQAREPVSAQQLAAYLKDDHEPGFLPLPDAGLGCFLDGLIVKYRGPREPSADEKPPVLSNNRILQALKIALSLRDVDLLNIMQLSGVTLSKSELTALFRRPEHRNFQPCGDQFLRQFLRGLGAWHRSGQPRT